MSYNLATLPVSLLSPLIWKCNASNTVHLVRRTKENKIVVTLLVCPISFVVNQCKSVNRMWSLDYQSQEAT